MPNLPIEASELFDLIQLHNSLEDPELREADRDGRLSDVISDPTTGPVIRQGLIFFIRKEIERDQFKRQHQAVAS